MVLTAPHRRPQLSSSPAGLCFLQVSLEPQTELDLCKVYMWVGVHVCNNQGASLFCVMVTGALSYGKAQKASSTGSHGASSQLRDTFMRNDDSAAGSQRHLGQDPWRTARR